MNKVYKPWTYFLVFILQMGGITSCAVLESRSPDMRTADKFFLQENYRAASENYEKVLVTDSRNAKALYKAGLSYLRFDKEKSESYIKQAYALDPDVDPDVLFWLGRAEHINYRFDEAIAHYETYHNKSNKINRQRRDEAWRSLHQAKNAKEAVANPKDVFVENLGSAINTMYSEHSPAISSAENYLLFTTRSEAVTGGLEARDGEFFEDIFEAIKGAAGKWESKSAVPGKLNSEGHDASIQLFDKDTKMLLYRAVNNGDIYMSERQADGTWGEPVSISDKVNSKYYEADAFITADGNTLYFSTNRFSKGNNLDIYKVDKQADGEWSDPESIGDVINSPFDEDSPFLLPDGRLYFSSRGHNTMGGYDIFVSKYDSAAQQWGKPENLGVPVNSPDDDTHYRLNKDGRYAFLSSYRIGGQGEKDIYTINYIRPAQIVGRVISQQDSMAIPGVEVRFSGMQANRQPITFSNITNTETGNYTLTPLSGRSYKVDILQDGKVVASEQFEVPLVVSEASPMTKDFYINYRNGAGVRKSSQTKQ